VLLTSSAAAGAAARTLHSAAQSPRELDQGSGGCAVTPAALVVNNQ
jgi:hypothetical protein